MEFALRAEDEAPEPVPSPPPDPAPAARDDAPAPEPVVADRREPEPARAPAPAPDREPAWQAAAPPPPPPPPAPPPEASRHEPPPGPAVVRAVRPPERDTPIPPPTFEPQVYRDPVFFEEDAREKPPPAVVRVQQPSPQAPLFGAPPAHARVSPPPRDTVPRFITELADATTQIVRGAEAGFAFGFYPDGNIRFVDDDGGLYAGKADSARARMREIDGMRAFTVQIGIAADGRLQATFTGGPHDSRTIALEPMVGWSAA